MNELEIGEGIILEDNQEYVVINIFDYKNKKYIVLSKTDNVKDIVIRILCGDKITGLSSHDEFMDVVSYYNSEII